jgi:coproporphyrinogen III oxidase-like Fe-S oxidoreductase
MWRRASTTPGGPHPIYLKSNGSRSETGPRTVSTVFFGGGTPSLMDPATVAAVLDAMRSAWPVANDLEVTLEANPGSVEAGRFRAFREAGVSRVSLGVQALNDGRLAAPGPDSFGR